MSDAFVVHSRFAQRPGVFADVACKVVVKVLTEESQDPRFSNAVILQHSYDFAFDIVAGSHASIDDRTSKSIIGLEVSKRVIDGQPQFPILQHDSAMAVWFAAFDQLRTKESVAVEEDR